MTAFQADFARFASMPVITMIDCFRMPRYLGAAQVEMAAAPSRHASARLLKCQQRFDASAFISADESLCRPVSCSNFFGKAARATTTQACARQETSPGRRAFLAPPLGRQVGDSRSMQSRRAHASSRAMDERQHFQA